MLFCIYSIAHMNMYGRGENGGLALRQPANNAIIRLESLASGLL
jgi:hypothetical protein